MAALWKLSLVLLSVGMFIALSSSEAAVSDSEGAVFDSEEAVSNSEDALIMSDFAVRSRPGWLDCNFTATPGASCYDCETRLICKKLVGFLIPCWWPGRNHCVDGECAAAPSAECAYGTTTLAPETTEPATTELN